MTPLERLYDGVADDPLRLTERGLFHGTALDILPGAMDRLVARGVLAGARVAFDAGAGDGRVLAALALAGEAAGGLQLAGLECDDALVSLARERLNALPSGARPRVETGDYLDERSYEKVGLAPGEIDVAFNYPDGNEERLVGFLDAHARARSRFVVLTPALELRLGRGPEWTERIESPRAPVGWTLQVYRVGRR